VSEAETTAGLQCVVFNARGCGDIELTTPRPFTGAHTTDMSEVVQRVQYVVGSEAKLFAVGFSLGAGIMVVYILPYCIRCPAIFLILDQMVG
jgi:predicted alpha/beta-fold hydrolase